MSQEDLENFLEEVRRCHDRGDIPNDVHPKTGKQNPFHDDPRIGPNIHTVNKYVIKPITLERGGGAIVDGVSDAFFVLSYIESFK
eukprot:9375997-Karenia_brevis.AAC.1